MENYAAEVAPEVDRLATAVHPLARSRVRDTVVAAGLAGGPGALVPLLTPLLAGPVAAGDAHAIVRYTPWEAFAAELDRLVAAGVVHRTGDGSYAVTPAHRPLLVALRDARAAAAAELWAPHGDRVARLLPLADRLVAAGWETAGTAFALTAGAPDPDPATPVHLLLTRVTALRYHRADAHAAAWADAGLTAAQVTALTGSAREAVERDTNRRAAAPYALLTDAERADWLAGLRALPGVSAATT